MTQSEARASPHLITGWLMICDFPTLVLFDFKATNSFIFISPAKSLNYKIEPVEGGMLISTP